jgi:hypothetical protein
MAHKPRPGNGFIELRFKGQSLGQLSCGYLNASDRMVILRCIGPQESFELLSFCAPTSASVQIWTHGLGGPELIESIDVGELSIELESPVEITPAEANPMAVAGALEDWCKS